jgi:hypothetical protein
LFKVVKFDVQSSDVQSFDIQSYSLIFVGLFFSNPVFSSGETSEPGLCYLLQFWIGFAADLALDVVHVGAAGAGEPQAIGAFLDP